LHQRVGGEHVDHALAGVVAADEIVDLERRFAKEIRRALAFEGQQLALDRADAGLGDVAILRGQLARPFGAGDQHLLQIFQIEQQQPVVVRPLEGDGQHAFLRLVQTQQPRQQQWPHFGDRGADRVALLAVEIPEHRRIIAIGIIGDAQFGGARFQLVGVLEVLAASHRDPGQIALHVGQEHRHPGGRELFGDALQGHGLARAGGPRDQPVAVRPAQQQVLPLSVRGKAEVDICHVQLQATLIAGNTADLALVRVAFCMAGNPSLEARSNG